MIPDFTPDPNHRNRSIIPIYHKNKRVNNISVHCSSHPFSGSVGACSLEAQVHEQRANSLVCDVTDVEVSAHIWKWLVKDVHLLRRAAALADWFSTEPLLPVGRRPLPDRLRLIKPPGIKTPRMQCF